jgi:Lar family restriction alleviation protein
MNPCPFCGSTRITHIFDSMLYGYCMSCEDCFARGPVSAGRPEAATEWNVRSLEHLPQTGAKPHNPSMTPYIF